MHTSASYCAGMGRSELPTRTACGPQSYATPNHHSAPAHTISSISISSRAGLSQRGVLLRS